MEAPTYCNFRVQTWVVLEGCGVCHLCACELCLHIPNPIMQEPKTKLSEEPAPMEAPTYCNFRVQTWVVLEGCGVCHLCARELCLHIPNPIMQEPKTKLSEEPAPMEAPTYCNFRVQTWVVLEGCGVCHLCACELCLHIPNRIMQEPETKLSEEPAPMEAPTYCNFRVQTWVVLEGCAQCWFCEFRHQD